MHKANRSLSSKPRLTVNEDMYGSILGDRVEGILVTLVKDTIPGLWHVSKHQDLCVYATRTDGTKRRRTHRCSLTP